MQYNIQRLFKILCTFWRIIMLIHNSTDDGHCNCDLYSIKTVFKEMLTSVVEQFVCPNINIMSLKGENSMLHSGESITQLALFSINIFKQNVFGTIFSIYSFPSPSTSQRLLMLHLLFLLLKLLPFILPTIAQCLFKGLLYITIQPTFRQLLWTETTK